MPYPRTIGDVLKFVAVCVVLALVLQFIEATLRRANGATTYRYPYTEHADGPLKVWNYSPLQAKPQRLEYGLEHQPWLAPELQKYLPPERLNKIRFRLPRH